jgi:hypothetical protein
MDFMEKYRAERDRLRAEIERNRTPAQRAEAEEIRARRHAYERLPGRVKTEMNELDVFRAFEAVADIGINAGSAQNAKAPEPDILCVIGGNPHYFELGEIADTSMARNLAKALERDEPTGGAFSQMEPCHDILASKAKKVYRSNGVPIDLLLHYQKQTPPWKQYFDEMVEKYANEINAVLIPNGGPFQRLWVLDVWGKGILLRLK